MLVYGPSAQGALRALASRLEAQTLNDLPKPVHLDWTEFSIQTLDAAVETETIVVFDLTHVQDVDDVLCGMGHYAQTITGIELRYIRSHWNRFESVVQFYKNGEKRVEPWQQP